MLTFCYFYLGEWVIALILIEKRRQCKFIFNYKGILP